MNREIGFKALIRKSSFNDPFVMRPHYQREPVGRFGWDLRSFRQSYRYVGPETETQFRRGGSIQCRRQLEKVKGMQRRNCRLGTAPATLLTNDAVRLKIFARSAVSVVCDGRCKITRLR